ncbi:hypothetical protein VZQ01_19480 [Myxococcus faecalis]|jgi:hypothetical protein|uniref:hypothetical protein n=1 Tax=Myxococcus TaxID=32 RepID=UPI001143458C|nr:MULTISPECIES: hypothetical protein [Myxococcus]MBZ4399194.1 hypothetical protein [Myxococcus sp. AS-1-15]MBZ4411602.1 hypothetical protein [Myxococcus sp. XM-1-1-1]MCK8499854.1 hypothetical protein [Myxococcus fulvus]BDT30376.1 hypothetical protein MFMH1_00450 [Myxococcus sp. MH1]
MNKPRSVAIKLSADTMKCVVGGAITTTNIPVVTLPGPIVTGPVVTGPILEGPGRVFPVL